MKKCLSILLVLATTLVLIPAGAVPAAAEQNGDYTYLVADSKAKIVDYTGSSTALIIPNELDGYPVAVIGIWAFSYNSTIISITVPDSVVAIENYAFTGCSKLTAVNIGAGVSSIGLYVFKGCGKLTQINASADNTVFASVSGILFSEDQKTLVQYPPGKAGAYTIPANVTAVSASSFYDCNQVTSISVGPGVISIGLQAFGFASGITQINVDEANLNYSSLNGVLYDEAKKTLIQFPGAKSGVFTVPETVENIGFYAFYNCRKVTAVTLPAGLIDIGMSAFNYCTGLTSVVIPDNVVQIGMMAFTYCTKMTTLTLGAKVDIIGFGAFNHCDLLTSLTVPDSVKTIGETAFAWCGALTTVHIGAGLETLGAQAFAYCENITGFTVDAVNASFSAVDGVLFNAALKELIQYPAAKPGAYNVPAGVEKIAGFAFNSAGTLTAVDIPSSVTAIADSAFLWCGGLATVIIRNGSAAFGEDVFEGCAGVTIISPPGSSVENYANMISFRFISLAEGIIITRSPDKTMYSRGEPLDTAGLEVMYIDSGLNIETLTAFSIAGYNADTFGVQMITVSYNGYTAEYEVAVCVILSDHPYADNTDLSWAYTHPEPADMLEITFSNQTSTEEDSDFIYLYDGNNSIVGSYTGAQLQGKSVLIAGNTFTIRLTSDSSVTDYGFDILSVTELKTVISSGHPYENSMDESWSYIYPEAANKLKVTFSPQTYTADNDFIYIYDAQDNLSGTFTGAELAGRVLIIDGNSFRVRLVSDDTDNAYGFDIIAAESFDSVISSGHPYDDDMDFTWYYDHPSVVTYLELTFSQETSVEYGYDFISIYDENGNLIEEFTGVELAGTTKTVIGSSFSIQLTSDSSNTDYGFDILTVSGFGTGGPLLTPAADSGCVVDSDNGYLYGLAPGITDLEGYTEIPEGYWVDCVLTPLGFGTGTVVNVINNITDEIVETYIVIIFGDINGDGSIDSMDAGTAVDVENYQVVLDPVEDAAYRMSADINGDGTIDSLDAGLMVDFENYAIGIDQSTGLYYTL